MTSKLSRITDIEAMTVDGCATPVQLWAKRCAELGERTAHREKDLGIWQSYSWGDYYRAARNIGLGLRKLGLERGQTVSILSEDRKEWLYTDYGVTAMGGIPNGVYPTDSAIQLAYLVADSKSQFLFVENDEQLDKYLEIREQIPDCRWVIVFDRDGLREFEDPQVIFFDDLLADGAEEAERNPDLFEREIEKARPEDIRMLIYTSGTTGDPKGAMISHRSIMYQMVEGLEVLDTIETDEQVCFLPLCHILERLVSGEFPIASGSTVNFAESIETVFDNVREVSPHAFTAVPRVWEKIYSQIQIMRGEATALGRWFLDRAIAAGLERGDRLEKGEAVPPGLALRYRLWDLLVLRNLRRMLGFDRLRRGSTGAAPIAPDIIRWYGAIGVLLLEGYGMTESSGVASANLLDRNTIGTVGPSLPHTKITIGEDSQILINGPTVFMGYWGKPEKTAEAITEDGWLLTGDAGYLDNNLNLVITGRIKDIIITAGGKNISPAEIENKLKFSTYVSDAVVIGDGRKYLTCLIMIDQENVENFAQAKQIPFSDFASLCAAREVVDLVDSVVGEVNKGFARVEQIKEFRLIDSMLTAEDEELTPTMKLKRKFVEERYAELIDTMYT